MVPFSRNYAMVMAEEIDTKSIVFNPFLIHLIYQASSSLNKLPTIPQKTHEIIASMQETTEPSYEDTDEKSWEEALRSSIYAVSHYPKFKSDKEFSEYTDKKSVLLTELFAERWGRSIGAGRHLSIGNIQLKGCGLSLPPNIFDYDGASGNLDLFLALKDYFLSTGLFTTLPLGVARPIGVQLTDWGTEEVPLGILVREKCVPRIAQYGLVNSEEEDEYYRSLLKSYFGNQSPREILAAMIFQMTSVFLVCGRVNGTSDNVLINGQFLDSETWDLPSVLGELNLFFDFSITDSQKPERFEDINWNDSTLVVSSFKVIEQAISNYHEFLSILFPDADIFSRDESIDLFFDYLTESLGENEILKMKKELCIKEKGSRNLLEFFKMMTSLGWNMQVRKLTGGHFSIILKRKHKLRQSAISRAFNDEIRVPVDNIIQKSMLLSKNETDPVGFSDKLFRSLGRYSFLLPLHLDENLKVVENRISLVAYEEILLKEWPLLKGKKYFLIALEGEREIRLDLKSPQDFSELIPLYWEIIGHGDNIHVLPAKKKIVFNEKNKTTKI